MQYTDHFAISKNDWGFRTTIPFKIHVPPGTESIAPRPHRTNPATTAQLTTYFPVSYLTIGFIQDSSPPWAFPPVAVSKKKGSNHIPVNYKRLEDFSIIGKLPIRRGDEVRDPLGEGEVFTTLCWMSGLFQTAIHSTAVELMAFCVPHKAHTNA